MGGVHWGLAADSTHVYVPISNAGRSIPGQDVPADLKPGVPRLLRSWGLAADAEPDWLPA
jgi:hypothetical protein